MVVTISGSQQDRLESGDTQPTYLVDIRSTTDRLSFCTGNAIEYNGTLYQPYLQTPGGFRTSANFPDNSTNSQATPLQFLNNQIEFKGTLYSKLSKLFDVFDFELADVEVKVLLTASGERIVPDDIAMPLVHSGTAGTPTDIDPFKFIVSAAPRNIKLNDSLPIRTILAGEFLEADRDLLTGNNFLGLVMGSGIRVPFHPTGAGATTTVTEQVDTGTLLKVSETDGFVATDKIVIGGFINNSFTVNSIDTDALTFTLSTDLSTLGQSIEMGTVIRENKTEYDYSIANHELGEITTTFVTPRDGKDFITISGSLFSKVTKDDPKAIDGKRDDLRINELIPFGEGGVKQQPENSSPGGNHNHSVAVSSESTSVHWANSVTPGGNDAANDGNEETFVALTNGNTLTFATHDDVPGVFVRQRYFSVVANGVDDGDWKMRRGSTTFLTTTIAHARGEFRSSIDTGGDEESDWNILNNESTGQIDVSEIWKEIGMGPAVTESTIDLTAVDRDTDVRISGANVEVGDAVEGIVNGPLIPDDSGKFGPVTASGLPIERPDGVCRYILEKALGQVGIIDEDAYALAATEFENRGIKLRFLVGVPTKLDDLFDAIATNSQAIHYWGRKGHVIKFMTDNLEVVDPVAIMVEDEGGVLTIDVRNSFAATDIKNELTGYFDKRWTAGKDKEDDYKQSVLGIDYSSQAKYGKRTGDIGGAAGSNALHFDMLTTVSGAQATIDKVIGNWSVPRKQFTINTTWAHSTLEPGDVIEVRSSLLLNNVRARIIEVEIDSRLFVKITARQIADAKGEHYQSVQRALQNQTNNVLGIDNSWTVLYRFKLTKAFPGTTTQMFKCVNADPFEINDNKILMEWRAGDIPPTFRVYAYDAAGGSNSKIYNYDDLFTNIVIGKWYSWTVRWDGTDLKLYFGEIGSLVEIIVSSKTDDNSITMTDLARRMSAFGPGGQRLYQIGIWNSALASTELTYLDDNIPQDFLTDKGNYTSSANLPHWYRLCFDDNDLSRDYGLAPSGTIDIGADGFATEADCRLDAPT